jgi:hypothetical protein
VFSVVRPQLLERRLDQRVVGNPRAGEDHPEVHRPAIGIGCRRHVMRLVNREPRARISRAQRFSRYADAVSREGVAHSFPVGKDKHAAGVQEQRFKLQERRSYQLRTRDSQLRTSWLVG